MSDWFFESLPQLILCNAPRSQHSPGAGLEPQSYMRSMIVGRSRIKDSFSAMCPNLLFSMILLFFYMNNVEITKRESDLAMGWPILSQYSGPTTTSTSE
jgi:hypothetical protein